MLRVIASLVVCCSLAASAHIALRTPAPRYADQKVGPCGRGGALDVRTNTVATYTAGDMIQVIWDETINHPGHYRISFDTDGQDFYTPRSFTDADGGLNVLVDNIRDAPQPNQRYTISVRLPDVPCTRCTLQVIQMMTDKPPYGDGNDIYFQCADIVLLPRDAGTVVVDAGVMPADGGARPDGGAMPDAGVMTVDSGQPVDDGGVVITPIPDAGDGHQHPDEPPMGCGCSGVPAPLFLLAAVAALWSRRRRA